MTTRRTLHRSSEERRERVDVPGGRLWTVTSGRGVPVVLCHGGPGSYDYLEPVASLFDDVARIHRYDQRGGGRSTIREPVSLSMLVADMEALRRHWHHDRWIVAGHSWGAHLALFYALAHPERVLGLMLLNGTGIRWGWGPERRARRLSRLTPSERAEVVRLEEELAAGGREQVRERLRDLWWLADFASRREALATPRFADYPVDPAVQSALERDWQAALDGIDDSLIRFDRPALVLHGQADPIGESGPRELAELLPRGRLVPLAGVGHLPWIENPDAMRAQLSGFVAATARD